MSAVEHQPHECDHEFNVWDDLNEILGEFDADFRVERSSASAWSGHLRVTLTNPDAAPSRSMTFFSAGAMYPEYVAMDVIVDFGRWMEESGQRPLPVPEWMRDDDGDVAFCSDECEARRSP